MGRKRRILLALLSVLALAGGWTLFRWSTEWRHVKGTDDAYVEGDITAMAPKVAGLVVEVAVADNQAVAKGDVLLRIDPRDFEARLAEARAHLAAREAALVQLDERLEVQLATVQQVSAGISAAQADLRRARQDLERSQQLVREDFVSRQRFDIHAADAAKAEAGVRGSSAQMTAARRQIAVLESERAVARAQVEQARAQVTLAETDLEATVIRAPVDGVVGNRAVRTGQYVRPGQHLLAVVPLGTVWVDANFKETQLTHIKPGNRARITVDAYPGVVIEGRVASFAPASGAKFSLLPPENATGNFTKVVQRVPVRIELPADNPLAGRLRPGLSVVAEVDVRE